LSIKPHHDRKLCGQFIDKFVDEFNLTIITDGFNAKLSIEEFVGKLIIKL